MATYAVVDAEGNIINTVVWDGDEEWAPPEGTTAVDCGDNNCQIGGTYKDGVFSAPPAAEFTKAELIAQAESMKLSLMSEANTFTQPWQTQLMLGIISDTDKASLTTWMKYYQQVQAIDTAKAPEIVWPAHP